MYLHWHFRHLYILFCLLLVNYLKHAPCQLDLSNIDAKKFLKPCILAELAVSDDAAWLYIIDGCLEKYIMILLYYGELPHGSPYLMVS